MQEELQTKNKKKFESIYQQNKRRSEFEEEVGDLKIH